MAVKLTYSIIQQHRRIREIFNDASCVFLVSLKLLNTNYTGYCLKIRRSSDNATQDIGFVNGIVDAESIATFIGAGTGYIDKWYDQSYNINNMAQTTTTKQPKFISNSILTDTTDDNLNSPHSSVYDFEKNSQFTLILSGNTTERLLFNKFVANYPINYNLFNGYQISCEADGKMSFILRGKGLTERIFVQSKTTNWSSGNNVVLAATYNGSGHASGVNLYGNGKLQPSSIVNDTLVNSTKNTFPLYLNTATATFPWDANNHWIGKYFSAIMFDRYMTAFEIAYIHKILI